MLFCLGGYGVSNSRAMGTEFLDHPNCDPALAEASFHFMEIVNRYFGGIHVVRRFLSTEIRKRHSKAPLRILDIGSGSCDIPLALSRWALANNIPLHLTCLEMAGYAIDIASRKLNMEGNMAISLLQEDVFIHQPPEPYDYAVASMSFHHFTDSQILILLERLRGFVIDSVLINDLRRTQLTNLSAKLLLSCTAMPAGVWHDALLSIQRGFTVGELNDLLQQVDNVTFSVEKSRWFRISAIIKYSSGKIL